MRKRPPEPRTFSGFFKSQRGNISPFLFGLLAGVALFSGGMKAKAELELQRIKEEQAQRERETAEQYKRAIEGSILSETSATYGTLDRERIEQNLAKGIGGGTRSGQDVAFGSITTDATRNEQRIIISTSDDDFVRTEVSNIETAADAGAAAQSDINRRGDIANIDTASLRTRQIKRTMTNMHQESELIYAFWGRDGVMPTSGEYATINSQTGLTDFWGGSFTYTRFDDSHAILEATTPWGQTLVVPMDLGPPEWNVFVTSGDWTGDLGGFSGADAKCQTAASSAGLSGTYMAWLSDDSLNPDNRFPNRGTPKAFRLTNGSIAANNWSDLTDGNLDTEIDWDENGVIRNSPVWTNTTVSGIAIPGALDCNSWTDGTPGESGQGGASYTTNSYWTDATPVAPGGATCDNSHPLYCFQVTGTP